MVVSVQLVFATGCTVKPAVDFEDANSWSVARSMACPAGTVTLKRRNAIETGRAATMKLLALPKFPLGLSALT
jgi:hypothetical protein